MQFFPVWTYVESEVVNERERGRLRVWGGGETLSEAKQAATAELERQAMLIQQGHVPGEAVAPTPPVVESRPLREELVERIGDNAITRHPDGFLMLNTPNLLIFDINPLEPTAVDKVLRFTSGEKRDALQMAHDRVMAWSRTHPEIPGRLYRTAGGWRVIITDVPHDAREEQVTLWARQMGTNADYLAYCQHQGFFRVRVSPKPTRVGMGSLQGWRHASLAEDEALRIDQWQADYEDACGLFRTCGDPVVLGPDFVHPDIADALYAHDDLTGAFSEGKLA